MAGELQTPITELELAQLLSAVGEILTPTAVLRLRRLAFERDQLKEQNNILRQFLSGYLTVLQHKEIRPPFNPGIQESLANSVRAALEVHRG